MELEKFAQQKNQSGRIGKGAQVDEYLGGREQRNGALVIFSGGTAFNDVASELRMHITKVSYVIPVSDDGGSTAEIIRVLGGPAVGDIRSRILRLSAETTQEEMAVKELLGHRLSSNCENNARQEWFTIADGTHPLWNEISLPYKQIIRRFLTYFTALVFKDEKVFRFSNGSIGNFFFAGARVFFASIEAAIFLYSRVSGVPTESSVLPVIVESENRINLACELNNGAVIHGQNAISHPPSQSGPPSNVVEKNCVEQLPSPIKRIFYTHMGNKITHPVNPNVLAHLEQAKVIVYGMGSLYTSIIPSLILPGVGDAISKRAVPKVLLLNGSHDRETFGLLASDFVNAITLALQQESSHLELNPFVTVVAFPRGTQIPVDSDNLQRKGIATVSLPSEVDSKVGVIFNTAALCAFLASFSSSEEPNSSKI